MGHSGLVGSAGEQGQRAGRWRRRIGVGIAATTLLSAGAATASAYGTPIPCTTRTLSAVFQSIDGDQSLYFLQPNGGFEAGAAEWQLQNGATVVSGNNTVFPRSGTRSLRIPNGGRAESRTICIARGEEAIRLVVNNAGVSGAILHVKAILRNPDNGHVSEMAFDVNGDPNKRGWWATPRHGIPNVFGGRGTAELTFRFETRGAPATWLIDDVYVDPFRSR